MRHYLRFLLGLALGSLIIYELARRSGAGFQSRHAAAAEAIRIRHLGVQLYPLI